MHKQKELIVLFDYEYNIILVYMIFNLPGRSLIMKIIVNEFCIF